MSPYANHYPTQRFSAAHIAAMPDCSGPEWAGMLGPDGYSRWASKSGRMLVTFIAPAVSKAVGITSFTVRPIISVPAGRREINMDEYFRLGSQWTADEVKRLRARKLSA